MKITRCIVIKYATCFQPSLDGWLTIWRRKLHRREQGIQATGLSWETNQRRKVLFNWKHEEYRNIGDELLGLTTPWRLGLDSKRPQLLQAGFRYVLEDGISIGKDGPYIMCSQVAPPSNLARSCTYRFCWHGASHAVPESVGYL